MEKMERDSLIDLVAAHKKYLFAQSHINGNQRLLCLKSMGEVKATIVYISKKPRRAF